MPPKPQNKGGQKKKPQSHDSDDDWVPTDVFGNPMPLVDTVGWDDVKTHDEKKRAVQTVKKCEQTRQNRQAQPGHNVKPHQLRPSQGNKNLQQKNDSDKKAEPNSNDVDHYFDHDGQATTHSQSIDNSQCSTDHSVHNFKHLENDKPQKVQKVFRPASLTLTSFGNHDHSAQDASAGSQPRTIRTIFAKQTPEEKEEQKKLTLIPLPTYSSENGEFLPQNITTLTPGYIPGQGQPLAEALQHNFKNEKSEKSEKTTSKYTQNEHAMPVSPLYQHLQLPFPRRPNIPNPKALSPQQYRTIEETTFHRWLSAVYMKYPPSDLNHFEHNLYVWKQLWLCCEDSDIVLIILDARNPLFHFNSQLYNYIVHDLKKPFVLVLNKIDLIPISIALSFKTYLEKTFPGVHVVLFSSYPSALHSLVLSLQHEDSQHSLEIEPTSTTTTTSTGTQQSRQSDIQTSSNQNPLELTSINMQTLIRHNIDLTPEDIAIHQRTIVAKMKLGNLIDTVGVEQLLQLCLTLVRGPTVTSGQISATGLDSPDFTFDKKNAKGNKNNKSAPQPQSLSSPTPLGDVTDDLNARRLLSLREQTKLDQKHTKQSKQRQILFHHLSTFISHAERVAAAETTDAIDTEQKDAKPRHGPKSYFRDDDDIDEFDDSSDGEENGDDIDDPDAIAAKKAHLATKAALKERSKHSKFHLSNKRNQSNDNDDSDFDELDEYIDVETPLHDVVNLDEDDTAHKSSKTPVFDMQRVMFDIYNSEEHKREVNNLTKRSLEQFEEQQRQLLAHPEDSDSVSKKTHKHPAANNNNVGGRHGNALSKAQLKEEEKMHENWIKANRIKIGFVGHTNVGKSSVVNAISRKKTVSVSRQPGHTKYNQTIKINELITLIDCPGLIFPALDSNKISSTLFGLYPIPQVSLPVVVIYYLAQMIDIVGILGLSQWHPLIYDKSDDNNDHYDDDINSSKDKHDIKTQDDILNMVIPKTKNSSSALSTSYTDNTNNEYHGWTANSICEAFALKRGFMTTKGLPDPQRSAQTILYLIADGKIQLYMLPPQE